MESLINPIVQSPYFYRYLKQLKKIADNEATERAKFYNLITEQHKAEFINGKIIMHSPVKLIHEKASSFLFKFLSCYVDIHNLGYVAHEKLLISLTRNDFEPDICFFTKARASHFKPNQMKFPAPDFVVEIISPSTEDIDRGIKMNDYAFHKVHEYWIIDPAKQTLEQYILDNEVYELRQKSKTGIVSSIIVKGFEIPIEAIFNQEKYLEAFQQIALQR